VSTDEAISVFRLVGRRPDAPLVYSDAGRRAARYAGRTRGGVARLFLEGSPRAVRRRLETRVTRAAARRLLGIELDLGHGLPEVRLLDSLATRAGYPGTGCYFYSTALAELLRVASGFEGAMVHDRCRARGDELCVWQAAESGDYQ